MNYLEALKLEHNTEAVLFVGRERELGFFLFFPHLCFPTFLLLACWPWLIALCNDKPFLCVHIEWLCIYPLALFIPSHLESCNCFQNCLHSVLNDTAEMSAHLLATVYKLLHDVRYQGAHCLSHFLSRDGQIKFVLAHCWGTVQRMAPWPSVLKSMSPGRAHILLLINSTRISCSG